MKFIPITYQPEMVSASLADFKKMTRRTKGLDKINLFPNEYRYKFWAGSPFKDFSSNIEGGVDLPRHEFFRKSSSEVVEVKCPYGQSGDILWVRENFTIIGSNPIRGEDFEILEERYIYSYKGQKQKHIEKLCKWKPSIHMPAEACRLWQRVKSVRVERLQDISVDDAVKEGIEPAKFPYNDVKKWGWRFKNYNPKHSSVCFPKASFQTLWQSINGEQSWNDNPWVWVIEFENIYTAPDGWDEYLKEVQSKRK